jgi:hypothetical protein
MTPIRTLLATPCLEQGATNRKKAMAFKPAIIKELEHIRAELEAADFSDAARVHDVVDQIIAAIVLI